MHPSRTLFVYGTLRKDAEHAMSRLLAQAGRFVGIGRVGGVLYDLGGYPGMVRSDRPHDRVVGELYALHPASAAAVLATLDAYEGVGPNDPRPHAYARQRVPVQGDSGETVRAWAYVLVRSPAGLRRIESGDYMLWRASRRGA